MQRQTILLILFFVVLLLVAPHLALPTAAQSGAMLTMTPSNTPVVRLGLPFTAQVPDLTMTSSPTPVPPHIVYFGAQAGDNTPAENVRLVSSGEDRNTYEVISGSTVDLSWEVHEAVVVRLDNESRASTGTEALLNVTESRLFHLSAMHVSGRTESRYVQLNVIAGEPTEPPVCGVSINEGALRTNLREVTLHMRTEGGTPTKMMISNDGGFAGATWQPFQSEIAWTLRDPGDEVVTLNVYVRFWNGEQEIACEDGNVGDDIIYDGRPREATATPTHMPEPTEVISPTPTRTPEGVP